MNKRHQGRKRAGVIAAAGLTTLIGAGVLAAPASAHTPKWDIGCGTFSFGLAAYNSGVTNTVSVKADGKVLLAETTFASTYPNGVDLGTKSTWDTLTLPSHTAPIQVELIVKAGDDPNGTKGYSQDVTLTAQPCETSTPTPPPGSPTPSTAPTPSSSVAPTSSAPAAVPSPVTSSPGTNLAETGSSSATPVIAGVAAVVVVAGGALVLVSRRRRSTSR